MLLQFAPLSVDFLGSAAAAKLQHPLHLLHDFYPMQVILVTWQHLADHQPLDGAMGRTFQEGVQGAPLCCSRKQINVQKKGIFELH